MTTANLTLADNDTVIQYTAVGGETEFEFDFPILEEAELRVSIDQVDQVRGTDFTVAGVGDAAGGTVTLTSAVSAGEVITLWLDMPIKRLTGFSTGASVLLPSALNTEFVRQVRHDQMLRRDIGRALRLAPDDPQSGQNMEIPAQDTRAGKFLAFDSAGRPTVSTGSGGGDTSLRTDLASTAEGFGRHLVAIPKTTAEANVDATIVDAFYAPGNVLRYGAVGNGVADDRAAFQTAFSVGELVFVPAGDYLIDSTETAAAAIDIGGTDDLFVECAPGARLIAGEVFFNSTLTMFQFEPTGTLGITTPTATFSWRGGEFNAEALTAAHGAGDTTGPSFMDLRNVFMPRVEGVRFVGGITTPSASGPGFGYFDEGLETHGVVGLRVHDCYFQGFADLAIYPSGSRDSTDLGTDPFTFTSASGDVDVAWPAHGLAEPEDLFITGAASAHGIDMDGVWFAANVTIVDVNTLRIATGETATSSGTGGGAAAKITSGQSDEFGYLDGRGNDVRVTGCVITRCGNAISAKRNAVGIVLDGNLIYECSNGLRTTAADGDPNSTGKQVRITNNFIYKIEGRPIVCEGGQGAYVAGNFVINFGRQLYDRTVFTGASISNQISGIQMVGTVDGHVDHNLITNELGEWTTGTPPTTINGIAIQDEPDKLLTPEGNRVTYNTIRRVYRGINQESTANRDYFVGNIVRAATVVDSFSGTGTYVGRRDTDTPVLNFGTSGSVTYDVQGRTAVYGDGVVHLAIYFDLASVSSPSGTITIPDQIPRASGVTLVIDLECSLQNVTITSGHKPVARLDGSTITLYTSNAGVLTALDGSALQANSRIAIRGSYPA